MLKYSALIFSLIACSCYGVARVNIPRDIFLENGEFFFEQSLTADATQDSPPENVRFPQEKASCGVSPRPYQAGMRHIEGKGIGYTKGYTSLNLFLAPSILRNPIVPFLDGRIHVFNNGRLATNLGAGLRFITPSFVYGLNAYYDYRATSRQNYNQISLGWEALGKVWDFRLNGYFPVGTTVSPYYNTRFGYFSDHNLYLSRSKQFAMKGVNIEAGIHIKKMKNMEFYGAFGPYYFQKFDQNASGFKVRISGSFLQHIKVEGNASYDPVFHWIGQGELSFVFPFGPKKMIQKRKNTSCSQEMRLRERSMSPVDRFEIMVINHKDDSLIALNPATGLPFHFIFVNNTSHSSGTFESPYPTLLQAQQNSSPHDVIYVFSGDGTTTGMDQGITLQPNQKFFGAGISQVLDTSLGLISIPSLSPKAPLLTTTTSGGAIVTLADNNEISGFSMIGSAAGYGILGGSATLHPTTGVRNASIHNNDISFLNATNACQGIQVTGIDTVSIVNNTVNISGLNAATGIAVLTSHSLQGVCNATISRNTASVLTNTTGANNLSGITIWHHAGTLNTHISSNTISCDATNNGVCYGLLVLADGSGTANTTIEWNQIRAIASGISDSSGINIHSFTPAAITTTIGNNNSFADASASGAGYGIWMASGFGGSAPITANVFNNRFFGSANSSGILTMTDGGDMCLKLVLNDAPPGIELTQSGSAIFKLDPLSTDNTPAPIITGTISSSSCEN